jgi:hypothetical protein
VRIDARQLAALVIMPSHRSHHLGAHRPCTVLQSRAESRRGSPFPVLRHQRGIRRTPSMMPEWNEFLDVVQIAAVQKELHDFVLYFLNSR